VPAATGRGVGEECRPVYRGLYFTLARDEDVEILGWLLAIPRSRRMRAIKAVLRTGLPAYAAGRHPDLSPLSPDTVRAALGRPRRTASGRRETVRADAIPASAPSPERDGTAARSGPDSARERIQQPAEAGVLAEAKLDRLLQSFLR
jgi:hypothetical protein